MSDRTRTAVLGLVAALVPCVLVALWGSWAGARLKESQAKPEKQTTAAVSDDAYCTPQLKAVVRRVASACGLLQAAGGARGCQPMEAQKVAALSGGDFNALFRPLAKRAAIIQFELDKADLDAEALRLLDERFADQRGASYFFVAARASPEGSAQHNSELSEKRANAVLDYLKSKYNDPDLEQEVGLLWLGEEFAQLDQEYCRWKRSRSEAMCGANELNRSAFITWIDCRL